MSKWPQGIISPAELARQFKEWLLSDEPTSGPCIICGSETTNERLDRNGKAIWLCLYDTGEGLACSEVWRTRWERANLPTHQEFDNKYGGEFSISEYDYDILDVPWRDERDEYHDYETYIRSREWNIRAFRARVLANWRCQRCGEVGDSSTLHAHHKHYNTLYRERVQDVEVLCPRCHEKEHRRGGTIKGGDRN